MFNALQRFLGVDHPANKVIEVKTDSLASLQVLHRDDSMVLYAPLLGAQPDSRKNVYEIILHRPCSETVSTCYSLYRSATQTEVEEKFQAFSSRLPVFVQMVKEMYGIPGLQKICDILSENPSWSLAHLVAYFNLVEYISNPKVVEMLDYPDHEKYMTPFQLAVKSKNMEMVKALIDYTNLDHLDNNSNSVFHYAANTSKEMVNLITSKSTTNLNHCNLDGYTPLHLACLSDVPECVTALLLAGADVNISAKTTKNVYNKNTATSSNGSESNKNSITGSVAEFLQVQNNPKLFTQDMKHGGTPLHWCSSKESLEALIQRGCNVNALNFDGRTALHIMAVRNRLECVVCLLAHEAEIDVKDMDGNTALHMAVEKKFVPIVQALVVFGCDINMKNKDGKSPRHMVGKNASGSNDDMILYILHSVGAKRCPESSVKCPPGCNAKGDYDGIPPAQPEATEQREHIQEMLAAATSGRGRNSIPGLINQTMQRFPKEKSTVIDTSAEQRGASVMDALLGYFSKSIQAASKKESPTSEKSTSTQEDDIEDVNMNTSDIDVDDNGEEKVTYGRGRLLCLDGGGIRGLLLVQMLLEIETLSQTPVHHLFDWIAGTSTGGILGLAVCVGKTMKQSLCLYLRMKDTAFVGNRPYPSENLENVLKENLGEFTTMADIKNPKIMITGVMADRKPVDLHLFRNYKSASEILGIETPISNRRVPPPPPEEQMIWRAARATGAAPSYFRAFGRFLDGGLIANNPTLDALTEIHEYNMALRSKGRKSEVVPVSVVVSLGTGLVPVTELKEIDVFRPDSIWDTAKLAYGISAIGNLLVDQATLADGRVVDRARAWCSMIGVPYFRFNPQMSVDIPMDEKQDEPLINMMWEAKAYMYANRNKLIEMINLLK